MRLNFVLALGSAFAALWLWTGQGPWGHLAVGFASLSAWQLFSALLRQGRSEHRPILRLGGFSWTVHDFCRGWLITGQIGTGKTWAAINAMLWQVSQNCPTWGGVCVDDKGVYWETLSAMFRHLGREQDLILLQVRPEGALAGWDPVHTFNFLDNPHLPYSAKAKILCDVASALGQRTEQSFFKMQAQVQMEFAFHALAQADMPVTLKNACEFLLIKEAMEEVMGLVGKKESAFAHALTEHYQSHWLGQPPEQLGGVKTTIANYLQYFTGSDIAQVFCPRNSSFDFDAIDQGKVICVSIPQRYYVERRYIHTLLKLTFYAHALRRFDRPAAARLSDNLLIFWADEAQKVVTASEDGMSDYNVADVIREARATLVAATQSYASLIPSMGDERKAKVLIANLANRITFSAADEDSARIAADTLGRRRVRKRTYSYSGGKRNVSWTDEDRYHFEPHELRRLKKFQAVVQHCEGGFRRLELRPCGPDGKVPSWYRH